MKDIIKTFFIWMAVGAGAAAGIEIGIDVTPKVIKKLTPSKVEKPE